MDGIKLLQATLDWIHEAQKAIEENRINELKANLEKYRVIVFTQLLRARSIRETQRGLF